MAKVIRCFVFAIFIFALFTGCNGEIRSTPGVNEPVQDSYAAFDSTVLTGKQVHHAVKRFKETLGIILVKGDKGYVHGHFEKFAHALGGSLHIESADLENVIDQDGFYQCFVLRDMNNEVFGIKLMERGTSKLTD